MANQVVCVSSRIAEQICFIDQTAQVCGALQMADHHAMQADLVCRRDCVDLAVRMEIGRASWRERV